VQGGWPQAWWFQVKVCQRSDGQNGSNPKDAEMASISKQNALAGRMTIGGAHFSPMSSPFRRLSRDIYEFMT
jgi:hypothetical protein